jgi:hypothetical protein
MSGAPDRRLLWLLGTLVLLVALRYVVFGDKTPEVVGRGGIGAGRGKAVGADA